MKRDCVMYICHVRREYEPKSDRRETGTEGAIRRTARRLRQDPSSVSAGKRVGRFGYGTWVGARAGPCKNKWYSPTFYYQWGNDGRPEIRPECGDLAWKN